jgi:hypothetical protein
MEIDHSSAASEAEGHDWRAEVGAKSDPGRSVDLARAREPGRGREAETPEQIPPRGWRHVLLRVFWSILEDRILSTSGSVAFFALLAVFPGIAAIVSLYGLFTDASTIGNHSPASCQVGFCSSSPNRSRSFPIMETRRWEQPSSWDC